MEGRKILSLECVTPDVPKGTPCAGVAQVTDFYYRNETWRQPTGYRVTRVLHYGRALPFKVYGLYGYAAPPAFVSGERDNVKVGFLLPARKPGMKEKVQIVFERTP